MSTNDRPIPTPPELRLRRIFERWGAPLALLVAGVATFVLWDDYEPMGGVTGYVDAERLDVSTLEAGRLLEFGESAPALYEHVEAGTLLARLDDRPLQAELAVLRAEVSMTRAELQAAAASMQIDRADRRRDQALTLQRLAVDVQELRLDVLDRRSSLEALIIEAQRAQEQYEQARRLQERGAETDFAMRMAELEHERLQRIAEEEERSLDDAVEELREAERRLRSLPDEPVEELDALLAPLRAEIEVHEARLDTLIVRLEELELRAPADGQIVALHRRPGESVQSGEPIVTLASSTASHVTGWIPNKHHHLPSVGQQVSLRRYQDPNETYAAEVVALGSQVEVLDEELRQDARHVEYGLPVRIELPDNFPAIAGERVDIQFR